MKGRKLKWAMLFLLMAALALSAQWAAQAGSSAKARANFTIEKYFSLEIKKGDTVDFGTVSPYGEYVKKNGTQLKVKSNTSWSIATTKAVLDRPAEANPDEVLNTLGVSLSASKGTGDKNNIKVDYTLSNLEGLPEGDYAIEVLFTGATD